MAVAVTIACAAHRAADRELHGSLRVAARAGVVLRRRDAADVDELSREGVRVAADPGEAGHPQLAARHRRSRRRARRGAADSGHRRPVAVVFVSRHVHRVRLHVAAVHDPAARGRAGESAGVAAAGVGGSRRAAGADVPHRHVAARAARSRRRIGVHVLADARRLHHPERRRRARLLHRHDGLSAAGHGRQHSARRGVLGRADRADHDLSRRSPSARERSMRYSRRRWNRAFARRAARRVCRCSRSCTCRCSSSCCTRSRPPIAPTSFRRRA